MKLKCTVKANHKVTLLDIQNDVVRGTATNISNTIIKEIDLS